jgi:hypothetical protein
MLRYWLYATHKKIFFYIFLSKTQTSQLIAIKDNKPCAYILQIYKKKKHTHTHHFYYAPLTHYFYMI